MIINKDGTRVFFWLSRGKHTKGQIGFSPAYPWEHDKTKQRFVDSVEGAVTLAKMLGWLSDSEPVHKDQPK